MKAIGHEEWFFLYASACAAVSLITYIIMPETRADSTLDNPPVT